ncbi:MAG: FecR domain-containing protein [Candidatus Cloacimonetes bacterium]|nr:FecR domain-containing protein [Candidatus Cloacimonadota bacterium]
MKKIIILGLLLIAFGYITCDDSIALTLQVKGEVELTRNTDLEKINSGKELLDNDELESKADSYAAVKFVDGSSIVKLFPNSVLQIKAEKSGDKLNKKSYLKVGELWTKVTKKTGAFEVETPTTVVSVKGTNFLLSVSKAGYTDVLVLEGEVRLENKSDGNSASIGAGNKAHSKGKGDISLSAIKDGDIPDEIEEEIEGASKLLEIDLENSDGETKKITIEFE